MSEETHYQMLWNCKTCGTEKLLGQEHRFCPNCGSPQDPKARYFPDPGEEVALEGHVYYGKDWTCAYCSSPSSASATRCGTCGAGQDGSKPVELKEETPKAAIPHAVPSQRSTTKGGAGKWIALIIGLVLLGIGAFFFLGKEQNFKITGHEWERIHEISERKLVSDGAFCNQVHGFDKQVYRTERKQSGTKKVPNGQDCRMKKVDKGDGTFTQKQVCTDKYKSVPVYDDFCYYREKRWVKDRSDKRTGKDREPKWPNTVLKQEGSCMGCEKISGKIQKHRVLLKGPKKNRSCEVSETLWRSLEVGQTVVVKVRTLGDGLDCGTLRTKP